MVQVHEVQREPKAGQVERPSQPSGRDSHHQRGQGRRLREVSLHGQQLSRRRKRRNRPDSHR